MTYSGGSDGTIPNGTGGGSAIPGNTIGSGVPGTDISDQGPGLIQENITINTEPTGDITFNVDPAAYVTPHTDHGVILAKLDELNAKVDHLLEHMHQPLTGTLQIDCPPKTPAGV